MGIHLEGCCYSLNFECSEECIAFFSDSECGEKFIGFNMCFYFFYPKEITITSSIILRL